MSYKYETLTKLDQHVNEMMATAGKKFKNLLWSRFLIMVQNVNLVTNGKRNRRLNPFRSEEPTLRRSERASVRPNYLQDFVSS